MKIAKILFIAALLPALAQAGDTGLSQLREERLLLGETATRAFEEAVTAAAREDQGVAQNSRKFVREFQRKQQRLARQENLVANRPFSKLSPLKNNRYSYQFRYEAPFHKRGRCVDNRQSFTSAFVGGVITYLCPEGETCSEVVVRFEEGGTASWLEECGSTERSGPNRPDGEGRRHEGGDISAGGGKNR